MDLAAGHIRERNGRFYVDRRLKLGSLIPNEIILDELVSFLNSNFKQSGGGRLLDVGAGTKPFSPVYKKYFSSMVSFDVSYSPHNISSVDLISSAASLPFRETTFDCILCTEVLEHVPEPLPVLKECWRVLRPGGYVFLTTPFLVPLHEMPHDYYRYTPSALGWLASNAGFELIRLATKGGYLGFALIQLQYPVTKFWQLLGRWTHLPLYHPYNPFLFLLVVLPSLTYVASWKRSRHQTMDSFGHRLSQKLATTTLGYVTVLRKKPI